MALRPYGLSVQTEVSFEKETVDTLSGGSYKISNGEVAQLVRASDS